jgi:hypothetical protein
MSHQSLLLAAPPVDPRRRELWLQHVAGRILFDDVRGYAINQLGASLDQGSRAEAENAIDAALYGLMMVIDGVTGTLASSDYQVELQMTARLVDRRSDPPQIIEQLDLAEGDGMCMGYHGWLIGDFGQDAVASPAP